MNCLGCKKLVGSVEELHRFAGALFCAQCRTIGPQLSRLLTGYESENWVEDSESWLRLSASIDLPLNIDLTVTRETLSHRLRELVHLGRELEIGDVFFDEKLWIEANLADPGLARDLLDHDDLRLPLLVLVQMDFTVCFRGSVIQAESPRPTREEEYRLAFCALVRNAETRAQSLHERGHGPYR
jgi:hypothetical protein